ncbi:type II toxin-antitoxin system YafQ family toxin [Helicobacter jaachi]|uniref:Type II toxin-antitoxin system YafQ family toxin n=1 Tax=Helicobacter jaachi TaxID=1677920 RepID=A0A4U8TDM5_9HELI|nr:type II toxin-antitoxin system YafQ family toxin [Helicobacter jaachi]TLD97398.1 type II toxin-antitoxin system YafQ family toxin [Helicobacter jaachi]
MAKFELLQTKLFRKEYKKLSSRLKDEVDKVLEKLENGETLESKHKDHGLSGNLSGLRDCHVRFDLVLIYQKDGQNLIITAMRINTHSEIFKK